MGTKQFPVGTFSWIDLGTTNVVEAQKFYGEVLNWSFEEQIIPNGGSYFMFKTDAALVGGMYEMSLEQSKATPTHWLSYVRVDSCEAITKKAEKLGATVVTNNIEVMDAGRMSVIIDPTGATFALWEAKNHAGAEPYDNKPGTFCWNELSTNNIDVAGKFYSELFGWDLKIESMPTGPYTMIINNGEMNGGIVTIPKEWGDNHPSCWSVYFSVKDCDHAFKTALAFGAKEVVPPTDLPVGKYCCIKDPQGATCCLIATKEQK